MALFKKKKKAALEIPPPPLLKGEVPRPAAEKMDIPDVFHEIKFSDDTTPVADVSPVGGPIEAKTGEMFEAPKIEVPEMPELPDIPEIEVKPEMHEHKVLEGPIFIRSRDYQEIMGKVSKIKDNIQQTEDVFKRMNEIKNEKDKIFGKWKNSLEDIGRKLTYVEKSLFEG
jgi:hypothetical protein